MDPLEHYNFKVSISEPEPKRYQRKLLKWSRIFSVASLH